MTASRGMRAPVARNVQALLPDDPGLVPQAERDALRRYIAMLPDPADYATALPIPIVEMLETCITDRNGIRARDARTAAALRPYGLCEVNGPMLSNFGCAVRRAALGID
jgi:hypothetical protein